MYFYQRFSQAELVIDELVNIMEDILAFGHAGIIVKMAELCVRHGIRQEPITQALLSAFHCAGQEKSRCVAALITSLTTYDIFFQEKSPSTDKVSTCSNCCTLCLHVLPTGTVVPCPCLS